ncbi:PTS sugar transporter subunit IIA [Chlamydiifrater phoenicopteri]|uniref:PTS sugar transporter subunit IIA n=1 Tax=Chlamydiifrater phoenicopteri TaxID=2681469 RepID=UPI001BCF45C9|nr:PTS sugar transporter subunit IIA [Chlamydiifrater phoenicopteri]
MTGCVVEEVGFSLESLFSPQLVMFSDKLSRDEVLRDLTQLVDDAGLLKDKDAFFQAIIDRENIMSTGIGMGVAIPHGKTADCSGFFVAVAVHSQGVLWDAIDGAPVRLIFLVGGPDNAQKQYLRLLSGLTLTLKDDWRRQQLLQVRTAEEIVKLVSGV